MARSVVGALASAGSVAGLMTAVVLVSFLCAVLPMGAALLAAAVVGSVCVLVTPLSWMLFLELILATIVAGVLEYFFYVTQAHWIPFLLALVLGFRALMEGAVPGSGRVGEVRAAGRESTPGFSWLWMLIGLYCMAMVAATLVNLPPLLQFLVAIKNYFFMWGVFFALIKMRDFEAASGAIWKAVMLIAVIQLPFVAYQKIFVASKLGNAGGAAGASSNASGGTH